MVHFEHTPARTHPHHQSERGRQRPGGGRAEAGEGSILFAHVAVVGAQRFGFAARAAVQSEAFAAPRVRRLQHQTLVDVQRNRHRSGDRARRREDGQRVVVKQVKQNEQTRRLPHAGRHMR